MEERRVIKGQDGSVIGTLVINYGLLGFLGYGDFRLDRFEPVEGQENVAFEISEADLAGVTSIDHGAFHGCSNPLSSYPLAEIRIPDSVTSIGNRAFHGCSSLAKIRIPDSLTSIGNRAFQGCSSLAEIRIPDSVASIGDGAFWNCTSLAEIGIPDSVTRIGNGAFLRCCSLAAIDIPDSVMSIGSAAFRGCQNLNKIIMPTGALRNRFLREYPQLQEAVERGDEHRASLKTRLCQELLFNDYWPQGNDDVPEAERLENLPIDERCKQVIDYYSKEHNIRTSVFSDDDVEIIKGVMTCLDYRKEPASGQALYKQLDKILSLGQMNEVVAQLCDKAYMALHKEGAGALQENELHADTLLERIAYLSTVDLSLNQYKHFQGLLPLCVNFNLNAMIEGGTSSLGDEDEDWADCLEGLQKVLDSGSDDEKRKIAQLFHDVASIQNDNDVHESLRLAAFRGEGVPDGIKTMADKAVEESIDVFHDAEEDPEAQGVAHTNSPSVSATGSGLFEQQGGAAHLPPQEPGGEDVHQPRGGGAQK